VQQKASNKVTAWTDALLYVDGKTLVSKMNLLILEDGAIDGEWHDILHNLAVKRFGSTIS